MSTRVLLLDNYDSFTYNLAQSVWGLGVECHVVRNDDITVEGVWEWAPSHLIISPGPGRPEAGGISVPLIQSAVGRVPLLGVCLGHQALAVALGGSCVHAPQMMHGKSSTITHRGDREYAGLPQPMAVARYHSLIVPEPDLPSDLEVSARTGDGEVMGIRHRTLPVFGVQYHPESVLTPQGDDLIRNFLRT